MPNVYGPPIGVYTHVQVIAAVSQTEIILNLNHLAALFGFSVDSTKVPGDATGVTILAAGPLHPDFNKIPAATRLKLAMELQAIAYHTDNAPTS